MKRKDVRILEAGSAEKAVTAKEKGNEKEEYALGTCRENNSSAERLFKEKGRKVAFEPES